MHLYLGDAPKSDVPTSLRRFAGFRPQTLAKHGPELITALDDEDFRGKVAEWLDDKPKLKKADAQLLSTIVERKKGWEAALEDSGPKKPSKSESERLREALDKERARTAKLKEEARAARESARAEVQAAKKRASEVQDELRELRGKLRAAESEAKSLRTDLQKAKAAAEKEARAVRRDVERATKAKEAAAERVSSLKREVAALGRAKGELERKLDDARASAQRARKPKPKQPTGPRKPLKAPKGLLDDAPETLRAWLSTEDVRLLVDGYNVGKAEKGFNVDLEPMRKRLADEVANVARKHKVDATIVFDGAEVAPGTRRLKRPPVKIVYSPPEVIADDVIVERVEEAPPYPIVVVTNDKDLQRRVARHGATVATSDQLLAMLGRQNLS